MNTKPFVRWVGGKFQILEDILPLVPGAFGRYFEPFVGGGALFFELHNQGRIKKAFLSDANAELMGAYQAVRDTLPQVLRHLKGHRSTSEHYYKVRARDPIDPIYPSAAARFIYLNRTCFNGLYRVNKAGKFNVPFGKRKNVTIDAENLQAVAKALRGVSLKAVSYQKATVRRAKAGDFVYFDPPYDGASFTSYTPHGFGEEDQISLAYTFDALVARGVHVLLSNADTPRVRELYAKHKITEVQARRSVNSDGTGRGKVTELLISGEPR